MRQHDTGKSPFQNVIGIFLQVKVDGQIHIVTGFRLGGAHLLDNLAQIIHQHLLFPLCALESRLHRLFNTGLSDHIVGLIVAAGAVVFSELILRDHAGISDDTRDIFRIIILSQRIRLDLHTRKRILLFRDGCDALLADIRCHRDRRCLGISVHILIIADGHNLQGIFHGIAVRDLKHQSGTGRSVCSHTQVFVHFLRRRIQPFFGLFFFLSCQIIQVDDTVDIHLETPQGTSRLCKDQLSLAVDLQRKIIQDLVPVCLQKLNETIDHLVPDLIFRHIPAFRPSALSGQLRRLIRGFQCDRVRQLIVGDQLSVAVIDISPGAAGLDGSFHLIIKALQMFLPLYDLEDEQPVDEQAE